MNMAFRSARTQSHSWLKVQCYFLNGAKMCPGKTAHMTNDATSVTKFFPFVREETRLSDTRVLFVFSPAKLKKAPGFFLIRPSHPLFTLLCD